MALDLSGQSAPPPRAPRAKAATSSPRNSERAQAAKTAERSAALQGIFGIGAFAALMFGGQAGIADAGACSEHAEPISDQAAALAETSESLAKSIDFITAIGPYAGLMAAAMPFALQVLVNHKRIPMVPQLAQFGVVAPEIMQAKAELEMQRQRAQMEAEMRDQMEEIHRLQSENAA